MDVGKQKQRQNLLNCREGFLRIYFEVGAKKACPPEKKAGKNFDTLTANPVHSFRGANIALLTKRIFYMNPLDKH